VSSIRSASRRNRHRFLGGLINYVLTHERWFKEYVLAYTNATSIINDEFVDTEQLDGLFQGFDENSSNMIRMRAAGTTKASRMFRTPKRRSISKRIMERAARTSK
jgi:hypothetical protein